MSLTDVTGSSDLFLFTIYNWLKVLIPDRSPPALHSASACYRIKRGVNVASFVNRSQTVCIIMKENILILFLFLNGSLASLSTHIFHTSVEKVDTKTAQRIYNVQWFNQTLDHFTFTTDAKFRQKYLVNDTYWNKWGYNLPLSVHYTVLNSVIRDGGPIFFYTGNEGRIESFAENTGFMWDIAAEFGAMLVFAEHRYYGESLPFGEESKSKDPAKVCKGNTCVNTNR